MEEEVEGAKLIIEEKVEHQLSCSISSFEFIVLRGLLSIFCPLRSFVVYFFVDPYLKYKKDKIIGVTCIQKSYNTKTTESVDSLKTNYYNLGTHLWFNTLKIW